MSVFLIHSSYVLHLNLFFFYLTFFFIVFCVFFFVLFLFFFFFFFFFFSSRRRHTRSLCDWSSDVCSSDLSRPVRSFRQVNARRDRTGMPIQVPSPLSPPAFHFMEANKRGGSQKIQ